jgi:aconitate hydratase
LVVAYAIAGTVDIDLTTEPIGIDDDGEDVYLADLWPSQEEIEHTIRGSLSTSQFIDEYSSVYHGSDQWRAIPVSGGALFDWQPDSTYIQEPPFFRDLGPEPSPIMPIDGARVLLKLGGSVTTDHISPAGSIGSDTPAGKFLLEAGVPQRMFIASRKRPSDDTGYVCKHPGPQPARPGH